MKLISKTVLPATKYRKAEVVVRRYYLKNGMMVELVDAPHGISSIYASTGIKDHDSIQSGEEFLLALGEVEFIDGSRIDFDKVRSFAKSYA